MKSKFYVIVFSIVITFQAFKANSQPCPPINAGTNVSICAGDSTQLNATGGENYSWSPATGLSDTSISNPIARPLVTTTYTVSSFVAGGNGVNVIYNGDFEQGNTGFTTDYPLCTTPGSCDNGTYIIGTSGAAHHSAWKCTDHTTGTGNFMIFDGSTNSNTNLWCQTVTVNPNTTYTFSCWGIPMGDYYGACSGDLHFIFNGVDIGDLNIPPSFSCPWTQFTTTWNSGSNTSVNICIVDACVNYGGNDFGIDDISLIAPTQPCSSKDSVVVTVNPKPIITVTPNAPSICKGKSVSLSASGATVYTWSPAAGLSDTTNSKVTANPSSTTTYTVTGNSIGCSGDTTVVVTVLNNPVVIVSPDSSSICSGKSVTLSAIGASNYTWSPSTGLNKPTGSTVIASPNVSITYTVTGGTGECTGTATAIVEVNPNPVVSVSPNKASICTGQSVSLTASGANKYTWSPATGLSDTTNSKVSANPTTTTTYTLTGVIGQCSDSTTVTVTVKPNPTISISPDSASICQGKNVILSATGATDYTWAPTTGLHPTTGGIVTANPSITTKYSVTGTTNGCSDSASVEVSIKKSNTSLTIPNVITPNGDNENDIFKVEYKSNAKIEDFNCKIFNRWGDKIYEWSDITQGWDGTDKGKKVSDGVYMYVIKATDQCGTKFSKDGTVTVLK